jgi:hypothetical protein
MSQAKRKTLLRTFEAVRIFLYGLVLVICLLILL